MSYFPINSPYYQLVIEERQLFWITADKKENGLEQEGIPVNLLSPFRDDYLLLDILNKIENRLFNNLNEALEYYYRFKNDLLMTIVNSQIPYSIISMSDLVSKLNLSHKKPLMPIILDFPEKGSYSFSYFTAKSDLLFKYALSHLLQDQIDQIIEKSHKINDNKSIDFFDFDSNRLVTAEQITCRHYINYEKKFATDNLFVGEALSLFLQHPEILIKFDNLPDSHEMISYLPIKKHVKKFIRNQLWRKFFRQNFNGNCYISSSSINYDNYVPCTINCEQIPWIDNLLPVSKNIADEVKESLSVYIIKNKISNCLAAKYLNLFPQQNHFNSYSSIRESYSVNPNIPSIPPFRY